MSVGKEGRPGALPPIPGNGDPAKGRAFGNPDFGPAARRRGQGATWAGPGALPLAVSRGGAFGLALLLAACDPPAPAAKPAVVPQVSVVTVQPHAVALTWEYAGRVVAFRRTEVRARVGGLLLQRRYVEGARVRAGEVLVRLDPAPYEASVAHAAALVQQAEAQRDKAARDQRRAEALVATQAGSLVARDDAVSAAALADANEAAARAALRTEALTLSWTTVTAPLSGITSLEAMPEGSLVAAGALLTTITQTDPVYVGFAFTDEDLATLRALRRDGGSGLDRLPATVLEEDGTPYPRPGAVDFTDSSVDQATGTVHGRALFPNPDDRLLPGGFVRIRIGGITLPGALSVPQQAVQQDAAGSYAWVVGADGHAGRRGLTLGAAVVDAPGPGEAAVASWVVQAGLAAGERVVTEGVLKVEDGHAVEVSAP